MGLIALILPWIVCLLASESLFSISHSYYSEARDVFVGLMSVVAAFLLAYQGHSFFQACFSKLASFAALGVAFFPVVCIGCESSLVGNIHNISAVVLFSVLAYFCLGPFRQKTKAGSAKAALRSKIYLYCGLLMVLSMLSILFIPEELQLEYEVIFWAEAIALTAFGTAWVVAGKYFAFLTDPEERLI